MKYLLFLLFPSFCFQTPAIQTTSTPKVVPAVVQSPSFRIEPLHEEDWAGAMFTLTNQSRAKAGLPALARSSVLDRAAEAKLEDMFAKKYFAHKDPQGKDPFHFFIEARYYYSVAGENLADRGKPFEKGYFETPMAVQEAFMASPTHRANVLNKLYTEIGMAYERGILVVFFAAPK